MTATTTAHRDLASLGFAGEWRRYQQLTLEAFEGDRRTGRDVRTSSHHLGWARRCWAWRSSAGQEALNKQTNGWWGIGSTSAQAGKDDKKLDQLLRILDFWTAPSGSEEYTFLTYGIEGRHYELDDRGSPVQTSDEKLINELNGN